MSTYENYSQTAQHYDATRIPVGLEIILGCLSQSGRPLGAQRLLDAGCGTGNYSLALRHWVGSIDAVDVNEDMLTRAQEKLVAEESAVAKQLHKAPSHAPSHAPSPGRLDFHPAAIHTLPFADGVFDGVIINQVLHHLELAAADDYPIYRQTFAELARVLKPGGALVVNTCSHEQLRHGFWYYHLIPTETERMCKRHAPLDELRRIMGDAGVAYAQCFVPVDGLMQGAAYWNPRGPLDPAWRNGDSMWSTVSASTLREVCARVQELERAGALENYLREHDARRPHIGQLSFLYGRRG